jgi:hypothetical protein
MKTLRNDLTRAQVAELLDYHPETGEFAWKNAGYKTQPGQLAGGINNRGYRCIRVAGHKYLAHRLAWLLSYGEWPLGILDHANGIRTDNRITNLREASHYQNCCNRRQRVDNLSGEKGVSAAPQGWRARINRHGKTVHLGYYKTIEEAAMVAAQARESMHGEFSRHK